MAYTDDSAYRQLFNAENLTDEEFDFALELLLHSKEVMDSGLTVMNGITQSDIVTMYFKRNGEKIHFNGAIGNDVENKWFDGDITITDNGVSIINHIHRLHPSIDSESPRKFFTVMEFFKFNEKKVIRRTSYFVGGIRTEYGDELEPFDKDEFEDFKRRKTIHAAEMIRQLVNSKY